MENIEHDKLIELLDAIYYQPCAQFVHFAQNNLPLLHALANYCDTREFEYQLNTPNQSFLEEAKQALSCFSSAKAFKMPLERPKYLIVGKEYDYVVSHLK